MKSTFLQFCIYLFVVILKHSTAGIPNNRVGTITCSEVPHRVKSFQRDEEILICCRGWYLLGRKCIPGTTLVSSICRDGSCPYNQVCTPARDRCSCPVGRTGVFCEEDCEPGSYGWGCSQRCHCPNREGCDAKTGVCDIDEDMDDDDVTPTTHPTVAILAGNNTALCTDGCGVLARIGCACNGITNSCECPGYAIALIVVTVMTWISIGGAFTTLFLKRKGYSNGLWKRYKSRQLSSKESFDEENADSGFNTEANTSHSPSWGEFPSPPSERTSSDYPIAIPPVPMVSMGSTPAYLTKDVVVPRSTSQSSSVTTDDHEYLNIPDVRTNQESDGDGEDYSQPYEFLGGISRQNSVQSQFAPSIDGDEFREASSFMIRTWTEGRALNNNDNSYVNESVLKWKRRFGSRRAYLANDITANLLHPSTTGFPLSSSCGDVTDLERTRRLNGIGRPPKPLVRPKPEFIKLKMLMEIDKRRRSFNRMRAIKSLDMLNNSKEDTLALSQEALNKEEPDDTGQNQIDRSRNNRLRVLRAALMKKGLSVPDQVLSHDNTLLLGKPPLCSDKKLLRAEKDECGDFDPIYENECVARTPRLSRLSSIRRHCDVVSGKEGY